jgi:hypothetical protein
VIKESKEMRQFISPRTIVTLQSIREELEQAWGPEGTRPSDAGDAAEPGESGAENASDLDDVIDLYCAEIADLCALQYDMDDDDCDALIYSTAEEMGFPLPEQGSEPQALQAWLNSAKSRGFANEVLKRASEQAGGQPGSADAEDPPSGDNAPEG